MNTKEKTDAKNLANLDAYMDELGMPKEDRDALPFGTTKTDLLSYAKGYEDAQQAAKEVADVGGWISVADALPTPGEEVLIFTYGTEKEQVVGRVVESGEWLIELGYNYDTPYIFQTWPVPQASTFEIVNVTHWQPLPPPPKTT